MKTILVIIGGIAVLALFLWAVSRCIDDFLDLL